jgi:sugar/nucleoside kinase (ribokinase family)
MRAHGSSLANCNLEEIILTNGPNEISGYDRGKRFQIQLLKAARVVDTTSVGDAFNAGYNVARHKGFSAEEAVVKASSLSSVVIGSARSDYSKIQNVGALSTLNCPVVRSNLPIVRQSGWPRLP